MQKTNLSDGFEQDCSCPSLSTVRPIFISGIMPRSGTNFLFDLLQLHPDCHGGLPGEDNVIRYSPRLLDFASELIGSWPEDWGIRQIDSEGLLRRCLGYAMLDFLAANGDVDDQQRHAEAGLRLVDLAKRGQRLVNKTPSVAHLDACSRMFPESYLIILVRDGRAIVESGIRSEFGWDFEHMVRSWNWSAKEVIRFTESKKGKETRHITVRYEDLFDNTECELRRVFEKVDLDPGRYDFDTAVKMPVRGSSTHKMSDRPDFFNAVPRSSDFQPKQRHKDWSRAQHERFNWIAGESLQQLGYKPELFAGNRSIWRLKNIAKDVQCKLFRHDL